MHLPALRDVCRPQRTGLWRDHGRDDVQAELNGPRPGVMAQHSPDGPPAPYAYAGDGHFAPPPKVVTASAVPADAWFGVQRLAAG